MLLGVPSIVLVGGEQLGRADASLIYERDES
jgi:hypothetical protein